MLRFHKAHGRNIRLDGNDLIAVRTRSFANALVFSQRPLEPNELFLVEIQEHEIGWAGNIRCGVTLHNPASILIPQYLLPDLYQLGKSFVFAIKPIREDPFNDLETQIRAQQEKDKNKKDKYMQYVIEKCTESKHCEHINIDVLVNDPSCSPCDINSRIGFFISPQGELYFLINGVQFGPCARNIPMDENVYAAVDLYGMTKQLKIIHCGVPKLSTLAKDSVCNIYTKEEVVNLCLPRTLKKDLLTVL